MNNEIQISVIIPISERLDDVETLYPEYKKSVEEIGQKFEFVYVIDGPFPEAAAALRKLQESGEPINVIQFAKWFGEATALTAGFEAARGDTIITLPAYYQADSAVIPELVGTLSDAQVAIAVRLRNKDSRLKRLQGKIFNWLVSKFSSQEFRDLGCGVRALRRVVTEEVNIYGDQHRFLPVLAAQLGFRVVEVEVPQDSRDIGRVFLSPGVYIRRILDITTVLFLTKFTKKPLRFFGLVGSTVAAAGGIIVLYLVGQRLFLNLALADRPALILGSLLVVLGVQLFAIGLIGELIIFTHAGHIKEYQIEQTVNMTTKEGGPSA